MNIVSPVKVNRMIPRMIISYQGVNYHIQDTIERMHVWWNETGEAMANMKAWHYEACCSALMDLKYVVRVDFDDFILCPETSMYMQVGPFFRAWGCALCDSNDVMDMNLLDDGTVETFPVTQDEYPSDEECIRDDEEVDLSEEATILTDMRNHFVEMRACAEACEMEVYDGDSEGTI